MFLRTNPLAWACRSSRLAASSLKTSRRSPILETLVPFESAWTAFFRLVKEVYIDQVCCSAQAVGNTAGCDNSGLVLWWSPWVGALLGSAHRSPGDDVCFETSEFKTERHKG